MSSTEEHIRAQLLNTKSLPVSTAWISNFLASISQNQQRAPPSALAQTALFRILTTDFTKTLSTSMPSTVLPREISDPSIKERRISGPVPVQVLDIEDIGSSMWSQVEKIEQVERGETIRGREIVRNVNVDDADNNNASRSTPNTTNGPHRLILQDAAGTKIVALEYQDINGISIEKLSIGAKLVLKDTVVSRGMALLTPETVTLLGGKIESWDTTWRQKRKEVLLTKIEVLHVEQNGASANGDAMEE
ncbi:hypothetical protein TMatcc_010458 [Talaromyces marneffei ATCC 18224]|uniref:RecQ-mediated genome instability protein 1 n=1 Tax=Talaromyces marneffei (strain ATCC 18224 / CBS 334.59 / QM 7333) TaxID=441960 RepID=B6QVJ4_TALMQ|nr:uncharacterized protein EYB26_009751 [Talaromyces marneffei]EEA18999.1 conserved hypothetical protein [Talaromyces marneffei ATCC 18224]QGA22037.1 hypothetical protein EYB26_009751 [Talaromyces marneffei]